MRVTTTWARVRKLRWLLPSGIKQVRMLRSIGPVPVCSYPPQQRKRFYPHEGSGLADYVTVYVGIRSEERSIRVARTYPLPLGELVKANASRRERTRNVWVGHNLERPLDLKRWRFLRKERAGCWYMSQFTPSYIFSLYKYIILEYIYIYISLYLINFNKFGQYVL